MLAGQGFVVLVPEIFHELEPSGSVLAYDPVGTERGNQHKIGKPVSAYDADARACLDHLATRDDCDGRFVTAGVCIGGHLAYRCAFDPRVRAAATASTRQTSTRARSARTATIRCRAPGKSTAS